MWFLSQAVAKVEDAPAAKAAPAGNVQQVDFSGLQKALDALTTALRDGNSPKREVADVRRVMIGMQRQGVAFKFDPLSPTDEQLQQKLLEYRESKQVANSGQVKISLAITACVLALAYQMCKPSTPPAAVVQPVQGIEFLTNSFLKGTR
jgi:hypothetical protein